MSCETEKGGKDRSTNQVRTENGVDMLEPLGGEGYTARDGQEGSYRLWLVLRSWSRVEEGEAKVTAATCHPQEGSCCPSSSSRR